MSKRKLRVKSKKQTTVKAFYENNIKFFTKIYKLGAEYYISKNGRITINERFKEKRDITNMFISKTKAKSLALSKTTIKNKMIKEVIDLENCSYKDREIVNQIFYFYDTRPHHLLKIDSKDYEYLGKGNQLRADLIGENYYWCTFVNPTIPSTMSLGLFVYMYSLPMR